VLSALRVLCVFALAACAAPPTPTPIPSPAPSPVIPAPVPSVPSLIPTVSAVETLIICLTREPGSLYLYSRPEPNRAHVLAALYDGPMDQANAAYQPVLLTKLPSLADGDAAVSMVTLNAGDWAVDEIGRVVTLTAGVTINLLDGATATYNGAGALAAPQITARFQLRPGVAWSDGAPLAASDSVFSFDISRSPDSFNPRRDLAERTASYRALSETEVEWIGLPGYIDPLYYTNFWTPLPQHRFAGLTAEQIADSDEARFAPLGWGPFVLREWVKGEALTFERSPNYFRAAEGVPRVKEVVYRFLPREGASVEGCDIVPSSAEWEYAGLVQAAGWTVQRAPSETADYLFFGLNRADGPSLLAEPRLRLAVAGCANLPHRAEAGLNPEQGRALLSEFGWADTDGDGVRDKDGQALALAFGYGPVSDVVAEQLAQTAAANLMAECGVAATLQPLTQGELLADWPEGAVFGRRFDLVLFAVTLGAARPCALFMTSQLASDLSPGGANASGYRNVEFDNACRRALTALDPDEAARWHAEAQRLFSRDLPALPLPYRSRLAAAHPQVQGYGLEGAAPSELWNIESVFRMP
jgi:peptide/nickel transport system substrate-binding protein